MNNRIAAFFDSYFDIIFAVNETPHPGEKRLLSIVNASCKKIPNNLLSSIDSLINNIPACNESILEDINNLVKELDIILKEENLIS